MHGIVPGTPGSWAGGRSGQGG